MHIAVTSTYRYSKVIIQCVCVHVRLSIHVPHGGTHVFHDPLAQTYSLHRLFWGSCGWGDSHICLGRCLPGDNGLWGHPAKRKLLLVQSADSTYLSKAKVSYLRSLLSSQEDISSGKVTMDDSTARNILLRRNGVHYYHKTVVAQCDRCS